MLAGQEMELSFEFIYKDSDKEIFSAQGSDSPCHIRILSITRADENVFFYI